MTIRRCYLGFVGEVRGVYRGLPFSFQVVDISRLGCYLGLMAEVAALSEYVDSL